MDGGDARLGSGDGPFVSVPKLKNKGLPCMHFFFIIDKWLSSLFFRSALRQGGFVIRLVVCDGYNIKNKLIY